MSNHVYLETHWVAEELQVELCDDYDQIKTMILEGVDPNHPMEVWMAVYRHPNTQARKLLESAFENGTRASYNDVEFDLESVRTAVEVLERQQHLEHVLPQPSSILVKPRM